MTPIITLQFSNVVLFSLISLLVYYIPVTDVTPVTIMILLAFFVTPVAPLRKFRDLSACNNLLKPFYLFE